MTTLNAQSVTERDFQRIALLRLKTGGLHAGTLQALRHRMD